MKLKEVIVVEGKHDSEHLKAYFSCDTIETQGSHLGKQTLALIAKVQQQRGIIIFTDPDTPGEKIRHTINQAVPGCKNAFIEKAKAHTSKKVGIEHACKADLEEALAHLLTYEEQPTETITKREFMTLGLQGIDGSSGKRAYLGNILFLGNTNAKTLYKRLNMLGLHKRDVEHLLSDYVCQ